MSFQENILGFALPASNAGPSTQTTKRGYTLHEAFVQRLGARHGQPKLTPQDLVSLLFRQRARARIAALPRVSVKVSVFAPSGRPAVQISL
jgi:hypothetical protein